MLFGSLQHYLEHCFCCCCCCCIDVFSCLIVLVVQFVIFFFFFFFLVLVKCRAAILQPPPSPGRQLSHRCNHLLSEMNNLENSTTIHKSTYTTIRSNKDQGDGKGPQISSLHITVHAHSRPNQTNTPKENEHTQTHTPRRSTKQTSSTPQNQTMASLGPQGSGTRT